VREIVCHKSLPHRGHRVSHFALPAPVPLMPPASPSDRASPHRQRTIRTLSKILPRSWFTAIEAASLLSQV